MAQLPSVTIVEAGPKQESNISSLFAAVRPASNDANIMAMVGEQYVNDGVNQPEVRAR
jgi:hypothetical protein